MKVTIKGILHWEKNSWSENHSYGIYRHDMSDMSSENTHYAAIQPVEFEVEIPDDFDPRPGIVKGMRETKQRILAEAQVKANEIDEQIQQLLSIEYKPEVA